jgi:hypothetical protein
MLRKCQMCLWLVLLLVLPATVLAAAEHSQEFLIAPPEHGYVSRLPASKWEESMLTGNGTTGALVFGDPLDDRIKRFSVNNGKARLRGLMWKREFGFPEEMQRLKQNGWPCVTRIK